MDDLWWVPSCFSLLKRCDGYVSGIVDSDSDLTQLLESHSRATLTTYNKWSVYNSKSRHMWAVEDYSDDVPLSVQHRQILTCQHSKSYYRKTQEKTGVTKKRIHLHFKKVDCPAKLYIRHVTRYDSFSVKGNASKSRKDSTMKRLKQALSQGQALQTSSFIHVKLPLVDAHRNHSLVSGPCLRPEGPRVPHAARTEEEERALVSEAQEQRRVRSAQLKLRRQ